MAWRSRCLPESLGDTDQAARAAFIMAAEYAGINVDANAELFEPPPKTENPKKCFEEFF